MATLNQVNYLQKIFLDLTGRYKSGLLSLWNGISNFKFVKVFPFVL